MSRRLVLSAGAVLALFTAMGSAAQGSFSPSPLVRLTHATPHLSSGLAARSNEFALDSDSLSDLRSTSYGRSLLVLPIIIGCFGMLMGIVFMLSVIARICFKSCRFEPDRDEVKGVSKKELQEWTRRHITRRETKKVQFIALFLLALAAIHVAYLGNQYLTLGFRNAVGSIDYMVDVFEALEVEGDSLQADGAVMAAGIAAALPNCSQAAAAQSHLADYDAAVAEYNAVVDPVPSELHDISGYSEKYGLVWRTLSMFCIYAAVMLVLVVYGVAYYFAWRSLMALVTVLNLLVIFALLIVCVFEMIIVVSYYRLADSCANQRCRRWAAPISAWTRRSFLCR